MKPILFNTEMVRAILDGRKTTTRRIIKPKCKRNFIGTDFRKLPMECRMADIDTQEIIRQPIPPYNPGDVLYVRETFCKLWELDLNGQIVESTGNYYYAADGYNPTPFNSFPDEDGFDGDRDCPKWHPSIHMPKEAARIFLRVTDVKAERLQDIDKYWDNYDREGMRNPRTENISIAMQKKFIYVWNSTVKKSDIDRYGWAANPWVWVISFERCEKPGATS